MDMITTLALLGWLLPYLLLFLSWVQSNSGSSSRQQNQMGRERVMYVMLRKGDETLPGTVNPPPSPLPQER